jgi:hypothetical protein
MDSGVHYDGDVREFDPLQSPLSILQMFLLT